MQSFTFHATEEKELHIVNAHEVALVVGEDVAVVELVVLLVVVEVVFEFAMKKGPEGPCCACRWSCRLELDHVRPDAQFVQVVRPALHHVPPCW